MQLAGAAQSLPEHMKNFYPDLGMLGKHYLLHELAFNGMLKPGHGPRQYTVATSMEPQIHSLLIDGLSGWQTHSKEKLQGQMNGNEQSQNLSLTVKKYPVGGVSESIHDWQKIDYTRTMRI